MATPISLRTLTRESILESLPQLNEILASCVNGGASVSFMQPFSPDTGERFWQRMAQSVAAGERIVLAAENQQRQIVGTVQLIIDQPENQPHRADVAKLLVHQNARRQGIAGLLMSELEAIALAHGKPCWCWIPPPVAARRASISSAAGKSGRNSAVCLNA